MVTFLIVDISAFLLAMFVLGIMGGVAGSLFLEKVIGAIWLPLAIILFLCTIGIIIYFFCQFNERTKEFVFGFVLFTLGEVLRSIISIFFFLCVLRSFSVSVKDSRGDVFRSFMSLLLLIVNMLYVAAVIGFSLLITYGIYKGCDDAINPSRQLYIFGIANVIGSVFFFIIVQSFLIAGVFPTSGSYFCEGLGLPTDWATKSILHAMFGGT